MVKIEITDLDDILQTEFEKSSAEVKECVLRIREKIYNIETIHENITCIENRKNYIYESTIRTR